MVIRISAIEVAMEIWRYEEMKIDWAWQALIFYLQKDDVSLRDWRV
jgi:hypothetical protein